MHIPFLDHILGMSLNDMVRYMINYYNAHHLTMLPLLIGFILGKFIDSLLYIFISIIVIYIILSYVPLQIPIH